MQGALDDITVLDLGQVIGMPFCTMLLADMYHYLFSTKRSPAARDIPPLREF